MDFLIADTFTGSLTKLTGNEQKAAKTTAFDLQLNPAQPGHRFHKVDRARDPRFWSVRVNRDVRMIVHRTGKSLLLCYVDHHDRAYQWAERRKLVAHPTTGAAQLVEVRETVEEITVPRYVDVEKASSPKPLLFEHLAEPELLSYGVPPESLKDVRNADEDSLLEIADRLPEEAGEALLKLAVGETPETLQPEDVSDPFEHPDAQRRFRVMGDVAELKRALEYPAERWAVFLHPAQRQVIEMNYGGPARVSGPAGTGKTIVAIHRAVFLAHANPDSRVLLTTISDALSQVLRIKLKCLIRSRPRLAERVEVDSIDTVGERLYGAQFGPPRIASRRTVRVLLEEAAEESATREFSVRFLMSEWANTVDAWQLNTWEDYRDVRRLGRKTRLPVKQRSTLWSIFKRVKGELQNQGLVTRTDMFSLLARKLKDRRNPPFDFAIVDEAQDVSVAQLRFLAALGGQRPNGLFFAGDLGQRIFQTPFSWRALGVDVRGRCRTLKLNYRTSHQIRMQADRLLGPEIADVDGDVEDRRGAVSAFNGEPPEIARYESEDEEMEAVATWLQQRRDDDVKAREIGVFVRSSKELNRARAAVQAAGFRFRVLDESLETADNCVSISTMHLAKGLEFRSVAVMACEDEVIPFQERIETVADDADLQEVYDTERHLLYVACTRARDHLLITSLVPASEFLDDLRL